MCPTQMLSHTFKRGCICLLLHNSLWPLILGGHYRLWLHQCMFEKQILRLHNCGGSQLTLTHISWSWRFLLQFEGLILLFGSFDKEIVVTLQHQSLQRSLISGGSLTGAAASQFILELSSLRLNFDQKFMSFLSTLSPSWTGKCWNILFDSQHETVLEPTVQF